MKLMSRFEVTDWDTLEAGKLFWFQFDNAPHLGMKVRDADSDACGVLSVPEPQVLSESFAFNQRLYALAEAKIVPSLGVQFDAKPKAGSLVVTKSGGFVTLLVATHDTGFFDVSTGKISSLSGPHVIAESWKIVVPGVDKPEVLWPASPSPRS
jgi:hypothetical protein